MTDTGRILDLRDVLVCLLDDDLVAIVDLTTVRPVMRFFNRSQLGLPELADESELHAAAGQVAESLGGLRYRALCGRERFHARCDNARRSISGGRPGSLTLTVSGETGPEILATALGKLVVEGTTLARARVRGPEVPACYEGDRLADWGRIVEGLAAVRCFRTEVEVPGEILRDPIVRGAVRAWLKRSWNLQLLLSYDRVDESDIAVVADIVDADLVPNLHIRTVGSRHLPLLRSLLALVGGDVSIGNPESGFQDVDWPGVAEIYRDSCFRLPERAWPLSAILEGLKGQAPYRLPCLATHERSVYLGADGSIRLCEREGAPSAPPDRCWDEEYLDEYRACAEFRLNRVCGACCGKAALVGRDCRGLNPRQCGVEHGPECEFTGRILPVMLELLAVECRARNSERPARAELA